MEVVTEQDIREIFALAVAAKAAKRHEEEMEQAFKDFTQERRDKAKAREKEEKEVKEFEEAAATSAQIAEFNQRLDDYDTATVHALMRNREALDKVADDLHAMRDNAYVLPDGRRAFKTQDGARVFDERGTEIPAKALDPHLIDDRCTKWEPFKAAKDAKDKLETERQGLLEFQAKIDDARTRADKGGITKKDLDALGADLRASAPPTVRQQLGLPSLSDDQTAKSPADAFSLARERPGINDLPRRVQPMPAPM